MSSAPPTSARPVPAAPLPQAAGPAEPWLADLTPGERAVLDQDSGIEGEAALRWMETGESSPELARQLSRFGIDP